MRISLNSVFISDGSRKLAHQLDDLLERWRFRSEDDPRNNNWFTEGIEEAVTFEKKARYIVGEAERQRIAQLSEMELKQLRVEMSSAMVEATKAIGGFWSKSDFASVKFLKSVYTAFITAIDLELRIKKKQAHEKLMEERAAKKRKRPAPEDWLQVFVDVAREVLTPEQFDQLKSITNERLTLMLAEQAQED